jgi:hypothetical protein
MHLVLWTRAERRFERMSVSVTPNSPPTTVITSCSRSIWFTITSKGKPALAQLHPFLPEHRYRWMLPGSRRLPGGLLHHADPAPVRVRFKG